MKPNAYKTFTIKVRVSNDDARALAREAGLGIEAARVRIVEAVIDQGREQGGMQISVDGDLEERSWVSGRTYIAFPIVVRPRARSGR